MSHYTVMHARSTSVEYRSNRLTQSPGTRWMASVTIYPLFEADRLFSTGTDTCNNVILCLSILLQVFVLCLVLPLMRQDGTIGHKARWN
jgi:hypothetical protein